jgi:hypothetical protein
MNIALLSTLIALMVGVTASAAAAAKIEYEWKVKGAALAPGATKNVAAKDKTTLHLVLPIGGSTVELTSSKLKATSGAKIVGGKPGTAEERLELEGVKVVHPLGCGVKEIERYGGKAAEKLTTFGLKTEVVEGAEGGAGDGKADLLFTGEGKEAIWSIFEFTGATCKIANLTGEISGSLLSETLPQRIEATTEGLVFEPRTLGGNEYRELSGGVHTAGLAYAGGTETVTGEAELELVSKELFGAF